MERVAWTDERLDDFARHVDVRFDQVDKRFDQIDARFDRTDARIDSGFDRIDSGFDRVDAGIDSRFDRVESGIRDLHATANRTNVALIVGLLTIVATLLARGG